MHLPPVSFNGLLSCVELRGMGAPNKTSHLKKLINKYKPLLIAILEPKQPDSKLSSIARR